MNPTLFVNLHKTQLDAIELPQHLQEGLAEKFLRQTFDAGEFFTFLDNSEGDFDCDPDMESSEDLSGIKLQNVLFALKPITAEQTVFLVDHMWSTTFAESRRHLKVSETLQTRIQGMIRMKDEQGNEPEAVDGHDTTLTRGDESPDVLQPKAAGSTSHAHGSAAQLRVDTIWDTVWRHMGCYLLSEDDYTQWYLMDEVGTAIQHSRSPNMRCAPLLVSVPGTPPFALSVMWPVKAIDEGDMVTRDYMPSVDRRLESLRKLRLLAFADPREIDATSLEHPNIPEGKNFVTHPQQSSMEIDTRQSTDAGSYWQGTLEKLIARSKEDGKSLKVFCDREDHMNASMLPFSLSSTSSSSSCEESPPRFTLVSTAAEADILYLIEHTMGKDNDQEHSKSGKVLNQFWWEGMLVSKEHLAATVKRYLISSAEGSTEIALSKAAMRDRMIVDWFPESYDLSNEEDLRGFLQSFIPYETCSRAASTATPVDEQSCIGSSNRSSSSAGDPPIHSIDRLDGGRRGLCSMYEGNFWILKRYRGRQSVDYPISCNLACLLRHQEASRRIASRYMARPALYRKRKFDLRFYVCVLSMEPLVLYRRKLFIVRSALQPYYSSSSSSLTSSSSAVPNQPNSGTDHSIVDLESFQRHFTVMNFLEQGSGWEGIRGVAAVSTSSVDSAERCPTMEDLKADYEIAEVPKRTEILEQMVGGDGVASVNGVSVDNTPAAGNNGVNAGTGFVQQADTGFGEGVGAVGTVGRVGRVGEETTRRPLTTTAATLATTATIAGATTTTTTTNTTATTPGDTSADVSRWDREVQPRIDEVLRKPFEAVHAVYHTEPPHPSGKTLHPNSGWSLNQPNACLARSMYGVDIILSDSYQPVLLEVQWAPDCDKALQQRPQFWDDVLGALYLDDLSHVVKL